MNFCAGHCQDQDEDNCEACGRACGFGEDCLSHMNYVVWECEPYCGVPDE